MQIEDDQLDDATLGPLVAKGRDADVFALGTDRVVRRLRRPFDLVPEAEVMEHVREAGYPVPRVWRVGPGEMTGCSVYIRGCRGQGRAWVLGGDLRCWWRWWRW